MAARNEWTAGPADELEVEIVQDNPVKDKNYNLLTVVQMSLEHVWRMENYIQDAERHDDRELAEWFRKIQHNNQKASDQGKRMLAARLEEEGS